jgi:hypothetical protein
MAVHRTTIVLPLKLKQEVTARARQSGISFGEFVRRALQRAVAGNGGPRRRADPLLDDHAVYRGKVPADLSDRHDYYLYGE